MKIKLFFLLLLLGVIFIYITSFGYKRTDYRVREVEGDKGFFYNTVFLTETEENIDEDKDEGYQGKIFVTISLFNLNNPDTGEKQIRIMTNKQPFYRDGILNESDIIYEQFEFLDPIEIKTKTKTLIFKKELYDRYYEHYYSNGNIDGNSWSGILPLNVSLSGIVTLDLGRVKINGEIYPVPKIYMQKYKEEVIKSPLDWFSKRMKHKPLSKKGEWLED